MNFLHKVGEALLKVHGNDLSHVQTVLPTHRACYFLRRFFLNKATNLWLPQMFTLPEWAENISGIKRADNLELILLLCELAKEIGIDEPTEELISLARVLCSDFEDMDMHMVKPDLFFRTLHQLAALKVFGTEDDKSSKREEYLLFWKRFERLYHIHRQRLLEQKKGDIGIIMRYVGENIENLIPSGQALYFIGFDVLTRAEEKIIKHLCEQGKAQAFWDTDNYYLKKQYHEAGYFFRKYQKEWKSFKPSDNDYILSAPKNIQIISATRSIGQVKAAAELIASLVNENEANRTVIVVNDEKLLQPLKYYLPQLECGYNLTMGLPILRSQSGEFFQILFHVLENSERLRSQSQPTAIYYKDLHALMLHPFCAFLVKRDIIRQIDETLRKKNLVFTEISFLREIGFPDIVSDLFLAQNDKSFLKSLMELTAFLYTSLLQHRSMDEEAEFMYKICEIIARCNSLLFNHSFSSKAIRNILKDSFRFTRIPFEGEPATGVQIMGLMETRCLDFDNVIMLSANEGIMPPTKIAKSYIPYALRSEAMFTDKERDCKISYLFYRLLQQAKNIFLIYDADVNTYGTGEKSRFLQQIEYELAQHKNISITQKVLNIDSVAQHLPPPIVIEKNPDILKKIQDHLKNGISPSALSTFINCSLQYYFKYIAGLKEPEDIEEDMDSSSMGTAIHSVLENLYQGA
ncbi:MAG: PD-(D/E)XK nuclease family protein, partial [Chitinophagales bacterium]|nr:PD-(D/E)XK nuclease family protein [Chitinophagales bacterium]